MKAADHTSEAAEENPLSLSFIDVISLGSSVDLAQVLTEAEIDQCAAEIERTTRARIDLGGTLSEAEDADSDEDIVRVECRSLTGDVKLVSLPAGSTCLDLRRALDPNCRFELEAQPGLFMNGCELSDDAELVKSTDGLPIVIHAVHPAASSPKRARVAPPKAQWTMMTGARQPPSRDALWMKLLGLACLIAAVLAAHSIARTLEGLPVESFNASTQELLDEPGKTLLPKNPEASHFTGVGTPSIVELASRSVPYPRAFHLRANTLMLPAAAKHDDPTVDAALTAVQAVPTQNFLPAVETAITSASSCLSSAISRVFDVCQNVLDKGKGLVSHAVRTLWYVLSRSLGHVLDTFRLGATFRESRAQRD